MKRMTAETDRGRRRGWICLIAVCMVFLLIGCSKKKEEPVTVPEPAEEQKQTTSVEPEIPSEQEPAEEGPVAETHEGEVRSRLNGLWIPDEYENTRPYAVMLNNIEYAYPQSGTENVSILYEILAEGGITRLMGIYDYVNSDRIGSVRSARHYFVTLAEEYDSIFIHFGQTKYAESKIKELEIDTLNGLKGEGTIVFYRDQSLKAPHNAFASAEGIKAGVDSKGYRTEWKEGQEAHFKFSLDAEVVLNASAGRNADKITLPFSAGAAPYLTYDSEKKLYYRYDHGSQHVDAVTKEPLGFATVLVQLVNEYNIDKNGYQTMDLENSNGKGYYVTGGRAVPICWAKGSASEVTHYYYDDARTQEILLNPGKIYIAVFPSYQAEKITIE